MGTQDTRQPRRLHVSPSENVSIFPGLLASSLIYFLIYFPSHFLHQDSLVLSAAVQGTGGPMPVPASAIRDRKKEGSLTSKDSVTAESMRQRECVSLLDVLWWMGTDTGVRTLSPGGRQSLTLCLHWEEGGRQGLAT